MNAATEVVSLAGVPECAGCGRCCRYFVALREGDDPPPEFVVEYDGVRAMDQHGDGSCVALDPVTQRCTIYERRPQTCRDFARGSALCRKVLGL